MSLCYILFPCRYIDQHKGTVPEYEVLDVTTQLKKPFAAKSVNKWSFYEICKSEITEGQDGDYLFELKGDQSVSMIFFFFFGQD